MIGSSKMPKKLYTFKADITREESFYLEAGSEEEAFLKAVNDNEWIDGFDVSGIAKKVENIVLTDTEDADEDA